MPAHDKNNRKGWMLGSKFGSFCLSFLLVLVVSGCATGVTQGTVAPLTVQTSRLVVYRPLSLIGIAISPMITIDGVDSCRIANGHAFSKDVSPGTVTITSGQWGAPGMSRLSFTAEGGQVYYVRFTMDTGETLAGALGGIAGQVVEQAVAHSGPFDLKLTDQSEMGKIMPGICNS